MEPGFFETIISAAGLVCVAGFIIWLISPIISGIFGGVKNGVVDHKDYKRNMNERAHYY